MYLQIMGMAIFWSIIMSYRFMRILIFFDLPSVSIDDKRSYIKFRKHLIRAGFIMLQESVYCKLALNNTVVESVLSALRKQKPPDGNIIALCITEKQFSKMELILGNYNTNIIDTDERLIIL